MRRKIISLHNISSLFRWVGFAILVLGLLGTILFSLLPFLPMATQAGPGVAGNIVFAVAAFVSGTLTTVLYAAVAFLISEMIQLMLRMEVDLKQIRFSIADGMGVPVAAPAVAAPVVAATSPVVSSTAMSDDAIEIDLPAAAPEAPPAKPAMDLYADRDKDVPFDVLITPKGSSAKQEEEESADSSPEMPAFETHEEETPKVDTRPISYCPNCNAMIRYKPEKKGKVIKCPKCTQPFRIGVS